MISFSNSIHVRVILLNLTNTSDLLYYDKKKSLMGVNFREVWRRYECVRIFVIITAAAAAVNIIRITRNYVVYHIIIWRACVWVKMYAIIIIIILYYDIVFIRYNGNLGDKIFETVERIADHMRLSRNERALHARCIRIPWRRRDNRRRWVLRFRI